MIPPAITAAWLRKTVRMRDTSPRGLVVEVVWRHGKYYARVRWHDADGQPDYYRAAGWVSLTLLEVIE